MISRELRVFVTHNPEDLDAYFGRSLPELELIADVRTNFAGHDLTTPELIAAASDCDVIIAHRATSGDAALFAALPNLLAFFRCAVDVSTIDIDAASAHGVLIANADRSYVASTAELALGLLLDCSRSIAVSTNDYKAGLEPPQRPGRQLRGQTAGIIGFGSIGSYLAEMLDGLGMDVVVAEPAFEVADDRFESVGFVELLDRSDVVFPLAQADAATENLIGAAELAAMKPGAVLINVGRGELLDEAAVADALDSGHLGALGIDVGRAADQRPSPPLAARDRVVATPHLGGLTPENADAQAASSVEQVSALLRQQMPPRALNALHATRLDEHWSQ